MFTCFVEATKDSDLEDIVRRLPPQGPDVKTMEKLLKPLLKSSLRKLLHEDNSEALEEALEAEKSANPKPPNKKGKKKVVTAASKEEDEFANLGRRILHFACALDAIECCKLLLTAQSFPRVWIDTVDETDHRSALHVASLYHSRRCIDFLLKLGANVSLKNKQMATPLEEALLSTKLAGDWDFSTPAVQIVEKVRAYDLAALRTLEPKCKDQLMSVAFKLAKGLKLVPLVALLIVTKSSYVVNSVAKKVDGEDDPSGTIVDLLLGKALAYSSLCTQEKKWTDGFLDGGGDLSAGESHRLLTKCRGEGEASALDSKFRKISGDWDSTVDVKHRREPSDWDDGCSEIKHRKDDIEWEEINSKYRRNGNDGECGAVDSKLKRVGSIRESGTKPFEDTSAQGEDLEINCKIARKILECVLLFSPRLSAHPQSPALPPLLRAAQANDEVLLSLLLESGAPINETDTDGNTALHWALRQATPVNKRSVNSRLVKRLLDAGGSVLVGNKLGATPVHTAAGHGHVEALSLMLEKETGAVNVMAATKETPLHYSVKNNHLQCTVLLLTHGANRNVSSLRSQKPYQLAPSAEMRALLSLDETTLREQSWDTLLSYLSLVAHQQGLAFTSSSPQAHSILNSDCSSLMPILTSSQFPPHSLSPAQPSGEFQFSQTSLNSAAGPIMSFSQSLSTSPVSISFAHGQSAAKPLPPSYVQSGSRQQLGDITQGWNSASWFALQKAAQKQSVNGLELAGDGDGKSNVNLPAYKTVLCRFFGTTDGCGWGTKCHFAHSEEELRAGQLNLKLSGEKVEAALGVKGITSMCDSNDQGVKNFKTKLCMHHEKMGTCPHGGKCKFAHGEVELRPLSALSASSSITSVMRHSARPSTASSLASSASEEEDTSSRKVFVGGLPHFIHSDELWEFFDTEFGKVVDAVVICGNDEEGKPRSRGFGFVLFEQQKDADEAVKKHYFPFRGKKVEVKRAMARMDSGDESGKIVSSLSSGISSPVAPQSPALPPTLSAVALFNDEMQLPASPSLGPRQGWSLPSLSVDIPQSGWQNSSGLSHNTSQVISQDTGQLLTEQSKCLQRQNGGQISSQSYGRTASQDNLQFSRNKDYHPQGSVHLAHNGTSTVSCSSRSYLDSNPCTELPSTPVYRSSASALSLQPTNPSANFSSNHPFSYYLDSSTSQSYFSSSNRIPDQPSDLNQEPEDEELSQLLALLQPPVTLPNSPYNNTRMPYKPQSSFSTPSLHMTTSNRGEHQSFAYQNGGKESVGMYFRDANSHMPYDESSSYMGGGYTGFSNSKLPDGFEEFPQVPLKKCKEADQAMKVGGYSSLPGRLGGYNPQLPVGSKAVSDSQASNNFRESGLHRGLVGAVNGYSPNVMNALVSSFSHLHQGDQANNSSHFGGFDLLR